MRRHRGIVAVLAALLLVAACSARGAEKGKAPPQGHIVRITAELTFDGKRIEIDDLIGCGTGWTGTPTSKPRQVQRVKRQGVFAPVPGGGMIGFRVTRELCYLNGADWGAPFRDKRAPNAWTPVIEWFDHRDLRQASEGLKYMSDTALTAPNGRLRITKPFRVTVPEHPPSPALIARALAQLKTRDLWPSDLVGVPDLDRFKYLVLSMRNMPWMIRIPESEWRNPKRAMIASEIYPYRNDPKPSFESLPGWLDSFQGNGFMALPYPKDLGLTDVARTLILLRHGRRAGLVDVYNLGIAKPKATRFGLLVSKRGTDAKAARDPYYPNRFDEFVPFKCVDGITTPSPETPGLIYWYPEPCAWGKYFKAVNFFDRPLRGKFQPTNGRPVLDLDNGDLWFINNSR